jgi:hypothetical protein
MDDPALRRTSMKDLITQLSTVLAVIIGALVSFIFSQVSESSRQKRLRRTRWDTDVLNSYIEFSNTGTKFAALAMQMCAGRGFTTYGRAIPPDENLERLATLEAQLQEKWNILILLGSTEVLTKAEQIRHALWRLEWFARGDLTDNDEFIETNLQLDDCRDNLIRAARLDLGIAKGDLPAFTFPPQWTVDHLSKNKGI